MYVTFVGGGSGGVELCVVYDANLNAIICV